MPTKELKELVGFVLTTSELVEDVADGVGFSTVGKLVETARSAGPGLKGAAEALQEYAAMTDAEAADLEAFVVSELDLADDKVELVIEQALKVAIELHALAGLIVKKPAA